MSRELVRREVVCSRDVRSARATEGCTDSRMRLRDSFARVSLCVLVQTDADKPSGVCHARQPSRRQRRGIQHHTLRNLHMSLCGTRWQLLWPTLARGCPVSPVPLHRRDDQIGRRRHHAVAGERVVGGSDVVPQALHHLRDRCGLHSLQEAARQCHLLPSCTAIRTCVSSEPDADD